MPKRNTTKVRKYRKSIGGTGPIEEDLELSVIEADPEASFNGDLDDSVVSGQPGPDLSQFPSSLDPNSSPETTIESDRNNSYSDVMSSFGSPTSSQIVSPMPSPFGSPMPSPFGSPSSGGKNQSRKGKRTKGNKKRKTSKKSKTHKKRRQTKRSNKKNLKGGCYGSGVGANNYDPNYSIYNTDMLKLFPYKP